MTLPLSLAASSGLIALGAGIAALGAGLAVIGAGLGVGRIGGEATQAMSRQPALADSINRSMLITAALVEGVALFGVVVAFLASSQLIAAM